MIFRKPRGLYLEFGTNKPISLIYLDLIPFGYQKYNTQKEKGEVLSLRKLYSNRQIHLRVFKGGEVRIHDEYNEDFLLKKDYTHLPIHSNDRKQLMEILNGYQI